MLNILCSIYICSSWATFGLHNSFMPNCRWGTNVPMMTIHLWIHLTSLYRWHSSTGLTECVALHCGIHQLVNTLGLPLEPTGWFMSKPRNVATRNSWGTRRFQPPSSPSGTPHLPIWSSSSPPLPSTLAKIFLDMSYPDPLLLLPFGTIWITV